METAGYDSSRPLAEQVAQRIKDYILEEKLKSGDKLPTETALAREMGVARSTVREAIKRLESQNILTVRHGAGSFVTDQPGLADDPLGLDFIEDKERLAFDLLEVRNIIEPAIAALAAIWWLPSWLPSSRRRWRCSPRAPTALCCRRPWTPTRLYWRPSSAATAPGHGMP